MEDSILSGVVGGARFPYRPLVLPRHPPPGDLRAEIVVKIAKFPPCCLMFERQGMFVLMAIDLDVHRRDQNALNAQSYCFYPQCCTEQGSLTQRQIND